MNTSYLEPITVTFTVMENQMLLPVITYIIAAINSHSLTSLSCCLLQLQDIYNKNQLAFCSIVFQF